VTRSPRRPRARAPGPITDSTAACPAAASPGRAAPGARKKTLARSSGRFVAVKMNGTSGRGPSPTMRSMKSATGAPSKTSRRFDTIPRSSVTASYRRLSSPLELLLIFRYRRLSAKRLSLAIPRQTWANCEYCRAQFRRPRCYAACIPRRHLPALRGCRRIRLRPPSALKVRF
jgi:hypothetical protein